MNDDTHLLENVYLESSQPADSLNGATFLAELGSSAILICLRWNESQAESKQN